MMYGVTCMQDALKEIDIKVNEALAKHCTFRIGGPARYFVRPKNTQEIKTAIDYCTRNAVPYLVIGNGSNLLFSDDGYDGAVIQIDAAMSKVQVEKTRIYAQAGALLSKVANIAKDNSLTGMEFAAGIPGCLGGAVVMNAGAYGGEMKQIVEYVDILEKDGSVRRYDKKEMDFGYRHSIVDADKIVLGASLALKPGKQEEILAQMECMKEARISKQPLEYPSAGSTFKRPKGYFAGKLIQDSGLRGYRVGGAMVSEKHSGFVINYDHATCQDVLQLMRDVSSIVKEKYGVTLEPEVRIIL